MEKEKTFKLGFKQKIATLAAYKKLMGKMCDLCRKDLINVIFKLSRSGRLRLNKETVESIKEVLCNDCKAALVDEMKKVKGVKND